MLVKKGEPPISAMHSCFLLPKDQAGANISITADTINIIVGIKDLLKPAGAAEVPAERVEREVAVAQNTRTPRLGNTWQVGGGGGEGGEKLMEKMRRRNSVC